MKFRHLLGVGGWVCPHCRDYSPMGYYFRLHLMASHGLSAFRASRFMVSMCRVLPVYRERLAVVSVPSVRKSAVVQADLFDSKVALV